VLEAGVARRSGACSAVAAARHFPGSRTRLGSRCGWRVAGHSSRPRLSSGGRCSAVAARRRHAGPPGAGGVWQQGCGSEAPPALLRQDAPPARQPAGRSGAATRLTCGSGCLAAAAGAGGGRQRAHTRRCEERSRRALARVAQPRRLAAGAAPGRDTRFRRLWREREEAVATSIWAPATLSRPQPRHAASQAVRGGRCQLRAARKQAPAPAWLHTPGPSRAATALPTAPTAPALPGASAVKFCVDSAGV